MLGLDYIQNVRLTLLIEKKQDLFSRLSELYEQFMDSITPFKSHMKIIKSRHILSIQAAFIFMRNLVSASISQIILFLPFIIFNSLDQFNEGVEKLFFLCKGFLGLQLPCSFFYSRMDGHVGAIYSLTLISFAMFRIRTEISNFIFFLS